jgi:hypothetical protein
VDRVADRDRRLKFVPLVVGITGHRDLASEDTRQLEELAAGFFVELQLRYPHTPLVLLSPLAEGADCLVARIALRYGARLIVPLPMERDLYIQDFTTPESRTEFDELLSRADRWYELPILPGLSREQIAQPGPQRNLQYEAVGFHISRESQILVAVMEEMTSYDPRVRVGGTRQIVLSRLGKITDPIAPDISPSLAAESPRIPEAHRWLEPILDLEDAGPVYQITARRQKNVTVSGSFRSRGIWLYPDAGPRESERNPQSQFAGVWQRLEEYNQDISAIRDEDSDLVTAGQELLLPEAQAAKLGAELQRIRQAHGVADFLASSMQKTTTRTMQVLFLLAYAAFVSFTVFVYCIWESPYLLLTYPALIGLAYLCYPPDRFQRWFWFVYRRCGWLSAHNKYLDYRALAEGLRVQFYWRLAGLPDGVAGQYLRRQRADVDWIREALNNLHLLTRPSPAPLSPSLDGDLLGVAQTAWIRSQARWFDKKTSEQRPKLETATTHAKILIATGILAAVALGFVLLMIPDFREWVVPGTAIVLMDAIHALLELAAVAGAFRLEYLEKLFCEEQVKRYERMAALFVRADQHLSVYLSRSRYHRARDLLRELGKEALDESADWLVLHRQNPPEVQT